jgi:hypothetical protein
VITQYAWHSQKGIDPKEGAISAGSDSALEIYKALSVRNAKAGNFDLGSGTTIGGNQRAGSTGSRMVFRWR